MSWLDNNEYKEHELCSICQEIYGTTQAIFKTKCNHNFHNNCLNDYCEHKKGKILCPVCRANIEDSCMDVWAFKNKALGNISGEQLFNGKEHVLNIYNNQPEVDSARGIRYKKRRTRITKRTRRTKRNLNKKTRKHRR
jgi:hypothetical protein